VSGAYCQARTEEEGIAVWTKHSQNGIDGNLAWIYHSRDCIVAKNPDEEMIGKMCRIARHLNAKVPDTTAQLAPV